MMLFKTKLAYKKVGISQNEKYFCTIVNDAPQFKVKWYDKSQFLLLDVLEQLAVENKKNCKIYAINDRFIWRKYLFFSTDYSEDMLYRQLIGILKQALPVPIEKVYFDYQIFLQNDHNRYKVILYALVKDTPSLVDRDENTILDSESYCYKRGVDHLFHLDENIDERENGYLFQDAIIQFKQQDYCRTLIEKSEQITDCKRLYFLQDLPIIPNIQIGEMVPLPSLNKLNILDPYLYITALGASLWNGKA